MIENIWDGLEERSFKSENDIKTWNLDDPEFYLEDIPLWLDIEKNVFCSYNPNLPSEILKNILMYKNMPNTENIENKDAFEDFARNNLNNPQFKNKFVAFVNGKFQDAGDKKNVLIKKMYDEFGNVDMYVHKITDQRKIVLIDTPEFT